jgi:hypothetical protein
MGVIRRIIVVVSMLAMVLGVVLPNTPTTSAMSTPIANGNYWEYAFDDTESDLRVNGSIKMQVEKTEQRMVSGIYTSVQVLSVVGTGTISGSVLSSDVTGKITIAGQEVRRTSNFSLISDSFVTIMNETVSLPPDVTVVNEMGYKVSYNPSQDDYIGDDDHVVGSTVRSKSHISGTMWHNDGTSNDTAIADDNTTLVLRVLEKGVSVTTVAGTFSCTKVNATMSNPEGNESEILYYSDVVGNYVKIEGGDFFFGGVFKGLTLKAYSYTKDSTPPLADAGEDQNVKPGDIANFDASGSTDNIGIVNYTWKFITGTSTGVQHTLYGAAANFTFEDERQYKVNLSVRDASGNADTDELIVTVERTGGISTLFKGTNLIIIVGAIAAAAVVLVALAVLRRRG